MPALAMPKDDWTPAKLEQHRNWRAKMYAQPKTDLLGAKIQVVADPEKAALESKVVQLEAAMESLREELREARARRASFLEDVPLPRRQTVEEIIKIVAKFYDYSATDLKSARRTADVTRVRHIAMYLAKSLTLRSLPEIGRHFGGRDHTTVLNGVRNVEKRMLVDWPFCQEVAQLEGLFSP